MPSNPPQPIMGRYEHPLLNKETGVYSYDELIVLRKTRWLPPCWRRARSSTGTKSST